MAGPPQDVVLDRLPGTPIALATGAGHAIAPPPSSQAWIITPGSILQSVAVGGAALLVAAAIGSLTRLPSPSREIVFLSVFSAVVLGIGTLLAARGRVRRRRALDGNTRFPTLPDANTRIGVVGREDQLAELIRGPAISDRAFEPAVFAAGAMLPMTRRDRWTFYACLALSGLALLLITVGGNRTPPVIIAIGALAFAAAVTPLIWPRTARLVPGRLDMLTSSFLGGRIVECRSYDLRTPVILVDLRSRFTLLAYADGTQARFRFPTRHPDAFVAALLSAAISTAPAAPLPDDALVG